MPDISKLPELCKILNISFEELVGERTTQTDIAEKLMQDENADVTLEEVAQVGQLVKPDKIERKVNETIEQGKTVPFSVLVELAPFMDSDTLSKMAEEIAEIDFKKLDEIIPFINRQTMDRIIDRCIERGDMDVDNMMLLAPFLSKASIQKLVQYLVENNRSDELVELAPFMSKDMFASLRTNVWENGEDIFFTADDELDNIYDLDEEEVAKIAFDALEKGKNVAEYLAYMDEDDVERLALKALEAGKSMECYLAYMDEDAVKRLLLKSIKK